VSRTADADAWLRQRIAAVADAAPTPASHSLVALACAAALRDSAAQLAIQAALAARAQGIGWADLDVTLLGAGLPAEGLLADGEAAFYYCATGAPWPPNSGHTDPLMVGWTCPACMQRITDTGPWSGPQGEGGHTPQCHRHNADMVWYATQGWNDDAADPDGGEDAYQQVDTVHATGERL
jgi:hypothetical protein